MVMDLAARSTWFFSIMAEYFSHDYGSRNDPKLVHLQMEMGHEGKGLFWDIIEIMYEQGGYITASELNGIAYALHSECERITKVLTSYDLFKNDGEKFWSDSVIRRLKIRESKSEKASMSAKKRWQREYLDANAMRTHSEGNAKKDIKGNDIKGNESKENAGTDIKEPNIPFETFWKAYDKKRGDKEKLEKKWGKLTDSERTAIMAYVPKYVKATPDKEFRKNPETFLNNKSWNDELPKSGGLVPYTEDANKFDKLTTQNFWGER